MKAVLLGWKIKIFWYDVDVPIERLDGQPSVLWVSYVTPVLISRAVTHESSVVKVSVGNQFMI